MKITDRFIKIIEEGDSAALNMMLEKHRIKLLEDMWGRKLDGSLEFSSYRPNMAMSTVVKYSRYECFDVLMKYGLVMDLDICGRMYDVQSETRAAIVIKSKNFIKFITEGRGCAEIMPWLTNKTKWKEFFERIWQMEQDNYSGSSLASGVLYTIRSTLITDSYLLLALHSAEIITLDELKWIVDEVEQSIYYSGVHKDTVASAEKNELVMRYQKKSSESKKVAL